MDKKKGVYLDSFSLGVILSVLAALCWGSTVIFVKIVLKDENPLISIIIRGFSAVIFILLIIIFSGSMNSFGVLFQTEILILIIIGGFLNALGEIFYFKAIKIGNTSIVQTASSVTPIFIATILIIGSIEIISIITIIGTIITVLGVGFVSQKKENGNDSEMINSNIYYTSIFLSLLAAFLWGISLIILRNIFEFPGVNTYSLTALRFFTATVFTTIIFLTISINNKKNNNKKKKHLISRRNFIILVYAGIMVWGIGSVAYFESIRLIGISRASPIASINPLITVMLGIIILKEKLNKYQIFGILIVIMGTIVVTIS
ncbi:MAG: DMT family transporter [Candidatus Lokiarchaeota archaeon]|nr:DMT family transporter [Candidatus Lokiarchaeota archaeon]